MNKDQKLLAEAYDSLRDSEASKAFMGDPADCHFANDLDGRVEKIRQQLLRGVKFRSAYMKWGHDGMVYRDSPHEDFEAALMPIVD